MSDLIEQTAKVATEWWAKRLMSGEREKFTASLTESIATKLREDGRVFVECDYDPQGILLDAVRAAGLECRGVMFSAKGILPGKHSTQIKPGRIEPKEGYGNWTDPIIVESRP